MVFSQSCIVMLCKFITEKLKATFKYLFLSKIIMPQPLHHWQSQEIKHNSVLTSFISIQASRTTQDKAPM
jgi:hypothetical protein